MYNTIITVVTAVVVALLLPLTRYIPFSLSGPARGIDEVMLPASRAAALGDGRWHICFVLFSHPNYCLLSLFLLLLPPSLSSDPGVTYLVRVLLYGSFFPVYCCLPASVCVAKRLQAALSFVDPCRTISYVRTWSCRFCIRHIIRHTRINR